MPRPQLARPFPFDPVLRSTGAGSLVLFAHSAGVHRRQVYRWRDHGLTLAEADTLACRLGFRPVEVWPVEYGSDDDTGHASDDEGAPAGIPARFTYDDALTREGEPAVSDSMPAFPRRFRACRWVENPSDRLRFAANSAYVEALWLPVLGPSATWALRRLAAFLDASHDCAIDLDTLARSIGLGGGTARQSVINVALRRLVQFKVARWDGSTLAVRRSLPPVPPGLRRNLPPYLNDLHERMTQDRVAPVAPAA